MTSPPLPPLPMTAQPRKSLGQTGELAEPISGPPVDTPAVRPSSLFPPPILSIPGGCWLTNYEPRGIIASAYDGTIRIEHNSSGTTASGDLYSRPSMFVSGVGFVLLPAPNPANGIPIQPRS